MSFIKCCGTYKAKSYVLEPSEQFAHAQIDLLEECPICHKRVLQLTRIDLENNVSVCIKTNAKAVEMFDSLEKSIKHEVRDDLFAPKHCSGFYLRYSEFGKTKKCFSNLSTLKMGLFVSLDLMPKGLIAV